MAYRPIIQRTGTSLDAAFRELQLLETALAQPKVHGSDDNHQESVPDDPARATLYWLSIYNRDPAMAARSLRELAAHAPQPLAEAVLAEYQPGRWPGASPFIERLLSGLGSTVTTLCDPATSIEDSARIAKVLAQSDPQFDARFAKQLLDDGLTGETERHKGLAILDRLGSAGRLIPILVQFLRNPDSRIRSKAAIMFGQHMPSQGLVERLMRDGDARVRANFVEGLWSSVTGDSRPVFRMAIKDSHHRVAANGLVGLYRLGETHEAVRGLSEMARHPEPLFRAAAAWVMGHIGDEHFAGVLRHMAADPAPLVRSSAARSLRLIARAHSKKPVRQC